MSIPKKITINTFYEYGVQIEDLPEDLQFISEIVGLDATFKLLIQFGGEALYFPKTVIKKKRNQDIHEKFNGSNYRELSKKFNISIRHIRKIIQDERRISL